MTLDEALARIADLERERDDWKLAFETANDHVGKLQADVEALEREVARLTAALKLASTAELERHVYDGAVELVREAQARADHSEQAVARLMPYVQHKPTCPMFMLVRFKPEPGWVATSDVKPCTCGLG